MHVPANFVIFGQIFCAVGICYLLGSLTCGFWICHLFKGPSFDIRNYGSGNIGFTNVWKVLGFKIGFPVLVADIAKSFLPILWLRSLGYPDLPIIFGILASGFGHGYSIFMYMSEGKFSGGKSVATFFGGFLGAEPTLAGIGFAAWLITLVITRFMFMASIIGGLAVFVTAFALQKVITWYITCGVITVYLFFKHIPNISRWIHHTEPKVTEKRGPSAGEVTVVFVIHPRDTEDLAQSPLLRALDSVVLDSDGKLSDATIQRICKSGLVLECGEITGIITSTGQRVRVLIMGVPLLPEQIQDEDLVAREQKAEVVLEMLYNISVQAERRGATVIGFGGLLSTIGKGGQVLQERLKENGFSIVVDNGAAYTIEATLEAVEDVMVKPVEETVAAVVGARGLIGLGLAQAIKNKVKEFISVVRDKRAESDEKLDLGTLLSSDELEGLSSADLIITCTSSPGSIFNNENHTVLKEGCSVLDVAYPPDFDDNILETRKDLQLVRCGLILLPGDEIRSNINFHFGEVMIDGKKRFLVPACLAQTILLGLTQGYEHASRSIRIRPDDIEFFRHESQNHGFRVITSKYSEVQIYSGEVDAK